MWNKQQIILDLRQLCLQGEKPDIYKLKAKYGYKYNSEFFPLLEEIRVSDAGLTKFIEGIFGRIEDSRDLKFIYHKCSCPNCPKK